MKARMASLADIPVELIRQKGQISIDALRLLFESPDMFAFTFHGDDGEVIGATWMQHGRLYNHVFVDSLVIDSEHRSIQTLNEAIKSSFELAMAVAKSRGATAVTTNIKAPRYLQKLFPDSKEISRTFKMEVA